MLTYRDLSTPLRGLDRFIPVRSTEDTLFTCVLEYDDDGVTVNDLVYERSGDAWELHKSSYRKRFLPSTGSASGSSASDSGWILRSRNAAG